MTEDAIILTAFFGFLSILAICGTIIILRRMG